MSDDRATPRPWAIHQRFKTAVVPEGDKEKSLGGSIYPQQESDRYAKVIARQEGDPNPEFRRSRVMPGEAEANAALIVSAVNAQPHTEALAEALEWALDLLDMYDQHLVEKGEKPEMVYPPIHLTAKEKARAALAEYRRSGQ